MRMEQSYQVGGLLGDPVDHSISHKMFEYFGKLTNTSWVHLRIRIDSSDPNNLKKAIEGIRALGFRGFNITIPFKSDIIKYLDKIDEVTRRIGAVNTIVNNNGIMWGYNTDCVGALKSIEDELAPISKEDHVVIFGAGGASRAISYGVAKKCRKITLIEKDIEKGNVLAELIREEHQILVEAHLNTDEYIERSLTDANYLINATPVGLHDAQSPLPERCYAYIKRRENSRFFLYDAIYKPGKTKFLQLADLNRIPNADGVDWMIYQGIEAFKIWTGQQIADNNIPKIRRKMKALLSSR